MEKDLQKCRDMNVQELIDKLGSLPKDAEVELTDKCYYADDVIFCEQDNVVIITALKARHEGKICSITR